MPAGSYFFDSDTRLLNFGYMGATGHLGCRKVRSKFLPQWGRPLYLTQKQHGTATSRVGNLASLTAGFISRERTHAKALHASHEATLGTEFSLSWNPTTFISSPHSAEPAAGLRSITEGSKIASYVHHSFLLILAQQLYHSLAKCDLLHKVNDELVPHVIVRLLAGPQPSALNVHGTLQTRWRGGHTVIVLAKADPHVPQSHAAAPAQQNEQIVHLAHHRSPQRCRCPC